MNPYVPLFQPLQIGGLTLKNRIVMSPMTTRLPTADHQITERMVDYFEARAKGGAAMLTTEAFYVGKNFAGPNTVALDSNDKIPMLATLCDAVHAHGSLLCVQLGCGLGRYDAFGRNGEPPSTSSAIPTYAKPEINCREMTLDEIHKVISQYEKAAKRAVKAGADAINIHGHNGYLIDQFMSAQFNTRTDEYGGSLENRMRYATEIVAAVRRAVGPKVPVIFRFSVDLCFQGSRGLEESVEMLRVLQDSGVDALDLDTGATESMDWIFIPYYHGEGCAAYVAKAAREGGITLPILNAGCHNPDTALAAVEAGYVDAAVFGRALVADPELPHKLQAGRAEDVRPCMRCNEFCSKRSLSSNAYLTCSVNAAAGNEARFALAPCGQPKQVAVIGAGPTGMEAARAAALKGHHVTLYEREDCCAKLLKKITEPSLKERMGSFLAWQERQLHELGVELCLNTSVTALTPELESADAIIVATGAVAASVPVAGVECALPIREAYLHPERIAGERVIVAGGSLSGCELALELAQQGKKVTVVERGRKAAPDCYGINRSPLMRLLKEHGVTLMAGCAVTSIDPQGLTAQSAEGELRLDGDTVIDAMGSVPDLTLFEALSCAYPGKVTAAGSCRKPGAIGYSVRDGYFAAFAI